MNRPIDTLYYQWVIEEEDKAIPTIFTDITEMEDEAKVNDLLNQYAGMVAYLIEAEVAHRATIDDAVEQAGSDPELQEMAQEDIAEAISMLENVKEAASNVEEMRNALDMFHVSFLKTVTSGE